MTRAIVFLASRQHADGSFTIYYCQDAEMTQCHEETPVYGAALIAYALRQAPGAAAEAIRAKVAQFLRQEQGRDGLWCYLPRSGPQGASFPPDLDDTSVSAHALSLLGVGLPGHAAGLLRYRAADGRFPTWVAAADERADPAINTRFTGELQNVDCGVNANVLAYLASQEQSAPEVCEYLQGIVEGGLDPSCSVYQPSRQGLAYVISRAYASGASCLASGMPRLRQLLLAQQDAAGTWGNALETALAINALLNAGNQQDALEASVRFLLEQQHADGQWPRAAYYHGHGVPIVYGSEELTTAFVLEALVRYSRPAADQPLDRARHGSSAKRV